MAAVAAAAQSSSAQQDSLPSPLSSLQSDTVTALARFEFEPQRGNEGTKVMMIEWQDDSPAESKHITGSWQISWQGKKTTFAAADNPSDSTNRLYFLLPPGQPIPPTVTIAYQEPGTGAKTLEKTVNPLPAIFTPELGATAKAAGKKGVLHTIWAKKRLQVLEKEIHNEEKLNLEGIALEMARAEKDWIEQNFGVVQKERPPNLDLGGLQKLGSQPTGPGPQSPRSPGGRRLTDRLKGLSLVTGNDVLGVNTPTREVNPLSPEAGDMAYSSFSAIRGERPSVPTPGSTGQRPAKRMAPIAPPAEVTEQQAESAAASLAAIAKGNSKSETKGQPSKDGEDLFAVALSPRSPDEPRSPFSIRTADGAGSFSKIKGLQTQRTF